MHYILEQDNESLILEPEDYTKDEWATILKIFGMEKADRIKISNYTFEAYGIPRRAKEKGEGKNARNSIQRKKSR